MVYGFADFELDDQLYQLRRSGETVKVEPQVFKLLAYLIAHRDRGSFLGRSCSRSCGLVRSSVKPL
jgi:DNA-binding winged helix-turn-helix (wHTH) protein